MHTDIPTGNRSPNTDVESGWGHSPPHWHTGAGETQPVQSGEIPLDWQWCKHYSIWSCYTICWSEARLLPLACDFSTFVPNVSATWWQCTCVTFHSMTCCTHMYIHNVFREGTNAGRICVRDVHVVVFCLCWCCDVHCFPFSVKVSLLRITLYAHESNVV